VALEEREAPHLTSKHMTMCNAALFASVLYYSPYWRVAPHPGPMDFIDAAREFQVGHCRGTVTRGLGSSRLLNYKNSKVKKRERKSKSIHDFSDANTHTLRVTLSEVT
jgi:hypothetical protein